MPDLRDLTFIKKERHEDARPQIEHAIIASSPINHNELVFVILPEFSNDHTWGPYRWVHNGDDFPQEGDDCLVAFSNRREGWVVAYWSGAYTPPAPPAVDSVFGRVGDVVAEPGDYDVSQVTGAESSSHAAATYETQAHAAATYSPLTRTPKITASALSGGPPATPSDGDIWIALAAGANGENWQFRYNAGSASPYKWEFIGGSKIELFRSTTDSYTSNSAWINDSNLGSITILRAGEYIIAARGNAGASASGAQTITSGLWYNGAISGGDLGGMAAAAASYRVQFAWELPAGVAAGSTVGLAMWDNSASAFTMLARSFSLIPKRIS